MKIRLIASLTLLSLAPQTLLAQNLPDEIDHVRTLSTLQGIQARLSDAQSKLAGLESEREQVRGELQTMTSQRRELPGRNSDLEAQIQASRAREAELNNEITSLRILIERVGQDVQRLENEVNGLLANLRQEDGRRTQITEQLRVIEADARRIQDQLDREVREENQSVAILDRLEREIFEMQNRRQQLADQHRARHDEHQRDQRELPQLRRQFQQTANQLQAAQNALAPLEQQLNQAQQELRGAEAEVQRLSRQLQPLERQVNQARTAAQNAQAELAKTQKEITDAQATIANLNQRKATAAQQIQALESARVGQVRQLSEAQVALDQASSSASAATLAVQAKNEELKTAQQQVREAVQTGNRALIAQAQANMRAKETELRNAQATAANASRVAAAARTAVQQREQVIASTDTQLASNRTFLQTVDGQISGLENQVSSNQSKLPALRASANQARQALTQAEANLTAASTGRNQAQANAARLQQVVNQSQQRRNQQAQEVNRLSEQNQNIANRVRQTEQAMASFARDIQQLENRAAVLGREIQQSAGEADRERRLLQRIRTDRVNLQQQLAYIDQNIQNVSRELADQDYRVRTIQEELSRKETERNSMLRYREESQAAISAAQNEQNQMRQVVSQSQAEIQQNNARLAQIDRDLPVKQARLTQITQEIPTVTSQISGLETQVASAQSAYNQRLSLFQRYLGEAQNLGARAGAVKGLNDGKSAGVIGATETATRLGTPVASEEGRFEAILRGFVRGEIAGFQAGRTLGLNSQADADRGTREGALAGQREARDHANQVLKPRFYETEFQRRLSDPSVRDEVVLSMANMMKGMGVEEVLVEKSINNTILPISAQELQQSRGIQTSLDERIETAIREISRLKVDLERLSVAANVYIAPTNLNIRIDAQTCSSVYKNVAQFVRTCQDSYRADYTREYLVTHKSEFLKSYGSSFSSITQNTRDQVIARDFNNNLREADAVARSAGQTVGREEVYRERFASARTQSYQSTLPVEENRVHAEALRSVDELFAANGVAKLQEEATLKSDSIFGVAPGTDLKLDLLFKNAGAQATREGEIKVRLIEVSSNLLNTRQVSPVKSLAARKLVKTEGDFGLKVRDDAVAGGRVRILAEVMYPGHEFNAQRTERIEISEVLGVNPAAQVALEFNATPKPRTGLFNRVAIHTVDVNLTAKHEGMSKGYDVSIEEIGSSFASFTQQSARSQTVSRGQTSKVELKYKLDKSASDKEVKFKITVSYEGKSVSEEMMTVNVR